MGEEQPKGVVCECGEFTPYSTYVYAHWRDLLDFTCPKCGKAYTVCVRRATPKPRQKRIKKKPG